ncbi:MAG: aldose epimerase family protein [Janthinobacterium lividum]
MLAVATVLALDLSLAISSANAAQANREVAGTLSDGTKIELITLSNAHGVSARILTYGATLQGLLGPDRSGKVADVMLGYDTLASYIDHANYYGVPVGRYANRIANRRFVLDGKTYQLPLNDKTNTLHGGGKGFAKVAWRVTNLASGLTASVTLEHRSPDGDAGYPGNLDVFTTYSLDEGGALTITFVASTDTPTVVNMTNHGIFNLAGEGAAAGTSNHLLTIPASAITPVNALLIPTGELMPVAGTDFDFRRPLRVADGIRNGADQQLRYGQGYDHSFAVDAGLTAKPKLVARLQDPKSGRVLKVLSTEAGVQFYTGNFLDGAFVGKHGHLYRMGDGIALEPQKFPDAPNQPKFV